jgi:hypothetical protein
MYEYGGARKLRNSKDPRIKIAHERSGFSTGKERVFVLFISFFELLGYTANCSKSFISSALRQFANDAAKLPYETMTTKYARGENARVHVRR